MDKIKTIFVPIDQQEIQVEVHAIEALKYFSLVRNLVYTSMFHHSNIVHIEIQWCSS